MKNKLIIGILVFFSTVCCTIGYAVANSVTLQTDKTNLETGETFSVKLRIVSSDGINGIFTTYNYDIEKLEIIENKIIDNNFMDLSRKELNEIVLMFNPKDINSFTQITEGDLYEITFKVKENAKGKTKITLGEIDLSTLSQTNSEHKLPVEEITININNENEKINLKTIIMIAIIIALSLIVIFVVKSKK